LKDNLLVFYYLSPSEIWPDNNRGCLWWERSYKWGTTVLYNAYINLLVQFEEEKYVNLNI